MPIRMWRQSPALGGAGVRLTEKTANSRGSADWQLASSALQARLNIFRHYWLQTGIKHDLMKYGVGVEGVEEEG